jgi:hypothetical protein
VRITAGVMTDVMARGRRESEEDDDEGEGGDEGIASSQWMAFLPA